jgi:hypothetical protein
MNTDAAMPFVFDFEFRDENGVLIARRTCRNLVTTAGKNLLGNVFFGATAKSADWYVGIKGTGTAAATDTIPAHAGWSEITAYAGARPTLTMSAFSGGSATNAGSPAVFTITSTSTIAGAFIVDNSVRGGALLGTLYNVADFSSPVTLSAGTVTVNGIVLGF